MNKSIRNCSLFFIRHGKLNLPYKNHNEMPFEILVDLASGKLNPPIDINFNNCLINEMSLIIPFRKIKNIYLSPSERCETTASLIANFTYRHFRKRPRFIVTPELKEIEFDLRKIYSPSRRKHFKIETVNDKVFAAMAAGIHCEHALDTYNRVKRIFQRLNKKQEAAESLLITHDFLMRVIEIYIKNHGAANPLITYKDLKNTKRNQYLHGFATDYLLSNFCPF